MFKALSIYGYKTTESDAKWAMLSGLSIMTIQRST